MGTAYMKQGDTVPALQVTIGTASTPAPLTGATVLLTVRPWDEINHRPDPDATPLIDAAAMTGWAGAVFADDGKIEYEWQTGDTDVEGRWSMEYQVTFTDLTVRTYPTIGFDYLRVGPDQTT